MPPFTDPHSTLSCVMTSQTQGYSCGTLFNWHYFIDIVLNVSHVYEVDKFS